MQSMESVLSLFFLVFLISFFLPLLPSARVDDSLWKIQIANDIWRVLYLRGDFNYFQDVWNDPSKIRLHADCNDITSKTGICIEFDATDAGSSNCIGNERELSSVERIVIVKNAPSTWVLTVKI